MTHPAPTSFAGSGPVDEDELRRYAFRFPVGWLTLEGVEAVVRVERVMGPGCSIESTKVMGREGG